LPGAIQKVSFNEAFISSDCSKRLPPATGTTVRVRSTT